MAKERIFNIFFLIQNKHQISCVKLVKLVFNYHFKTKTKNIFN